ncbi:uncharacterized protein LOC132198886 [Neocloeon triangulifer]|uniref:uncharacterized protein LOC132198886 n=1 Tax=Neocloeon triangulifer TaxID=2078957 RepID=UPI00286F3E3C|nr:uncharacterized protein LOC132198886 [Neocloeon triangulifer]
MSSGVSAANSQRLQKLFDGVDSDADDADDGFYSKVQEPKAHQDGESISFSQSSSPTPSQNLQPNESYALSFDNPMSNQDFVILEQPPDEILQLPSNDEMFAVITKNKSVDELTKENALLKEILIQKNAELHNSHDVLEVNKNLIASNEALISAKENKIVDLMNELKHTKRSNKMLLRTVVNFAQKLKQNGLLTNYYIKKLSTWKKDLDENKDGNQNPFDIEEEKLPPVEDATKEAPKVVEQQLTSEVRIKLIRCDADQVETPEAAPILVEKTENDVMNVPVSEQEASNLSSKLVIDEEAPVEDPEENTPVMGSKMEVSVDIPQVDAPVKNFEKDAAAKDLVNEAPADVFEKVAPVQDEEMEADAELQQLEMLQANDDQMDADEASKEPEKMQVDKILEPGEGDKTQIDVTSEEDANIRKFNERLLVRVPRKHLKRLSVSMKTPVLLGIWRFSPTSVTKRLLTYKPTLLKLFGVLDDTATKTCIDIEAIPLEQIYEMYQSGNQEEDSADDSATSSEELSGSDSSALESEDDIPAVVEPPKEKEKTRSQGKKPSKVQQLKGEQKENSADDSATSSEELPGSDSSALESEDDIPAVVEPPKEKEKTRSQGKKPSKVQQLKAKMSKNNPVLQKKRNK